MTDPEQIEVVEPPCERCDLSDLPEGYACPAIDYCPKMTRPE